MAPRRNAPPIKVLYDKLLTAFDAAEVAVAEFQMAYLRGPARKGVEHLESHADAFRRGYLAAFASVAFFAEEPLRKLIRDMLEKKKITSETTKIRKELLKHRQGKGVSEVNRQLYDEIDRLVMGSKRSVNNGRKRKSEIVRTAIKTLEERKVVGKGEIDPQKAYKAYFSLKRRLNKEKK